MSLRLSGLFIYPIKSARGIAVSAAQLTPRGLSDDRRFMVVDADGLFLTQRQLPAMARLVPSIAHGRMRVTFDDLEPLLVPLTPSEGTPCSVRVFQDHVVALDLGAEPAAFLSRALGRTARLVYMPDSSLRPVHRDYSEQSDIVSFADGFPFLLASEASLEELNGRLSQRIGMDRIRPNLVVSGGAAFAEDHWKRLHIGGALFEVRKPCTRCAIITTDQHLGVRASKDPLTALAGLHSWQGKAAFGQNLICRSSGELQVGANVVVLT